MMARRLFQDRGRLVMLAKLAQRPLAAPIGRIQIAGIVFEHSGINVLRFFQPAGLEQKARLAVLKNRILRRALIGFEEFAIAAQPVQKIVIGKMHRRIFGVTRQALFQHRRCFVKAQQFL